MRSVTYPFLVGTPRPDRTIPLLDAEFRYTTKYTREMEQSCGTNLDTLLFRGQAVLINVLLVCYGLKWNPELKMNEDKAIDLIDAFIDAGGDTADLSKVLYEALGQSGVYGKPKPKVGADPLTTTPETPTPAADATTVPAAA